MLYILSLLPLTTFFFKFPFKLGTYFGAGNQDTSSIDSSKHRFLFVPCCTNAAVTMPFFTIEQGRGHHLLKHRTLSVEKHHLKTRI